MFRSTIFIVHKIKSTELNVRHGVPAVSTVSCRDLSDSGYFVAVLKNVRRLQNAKRSRKFTPFKFLLRQRSSSNDYWPVVLIMPSDGIFVN